MQVVSPPHPAELEDEELLKDCRQEGGRGSGPGGQNRNMVETAIELTHKPTGVMAHADERRTRAENLRVAIRRLRIRLAIGLRTERDLIAEPSPRWAARVRGKQIAINPDHRDYPALLAEALDVLWLKRFDPKPAAILLCVSPSQLIRMVGKEPEALSVVNQRRKERGRHELKT